jgi:uncharacterized RDD family membrane protein YckC
MSANTDPTDLPPWRSPLLRLLAINLVGGIIIAVLTVGGLMLLDPFGLRRLILQDQSPLTAFLLLLFGFVITFGSWVMGTAIMLLGREPKGPPAGKGRRLAALDRGSLDGSVNPPQPVPVVNPKRPRRDQTDGGRGVFAA